MKEELPGLTQLLVEHHVKEVVDEVTCGDRQLVVEVVWGGGLMPPFRFLFMKQKQQVILNGEGLS